jgi:thiol:disulfide interchange protein
LRKFAFPMMRYFLNASGLSRLLFFPFLLLAFAGHSQVLHPAKWRTSVSETKLNAGDETDLIFHVTIDPDWYLYSSDFDPDLGPMLTEFGFKPHSSYKVIGKIKPINPKKKYDDTWGGEYTYFTGHAEFRQRVKVLQPNPEIKGVYKYQVCTDKTGQCIPFEEDFAFSGIQVSAAAESSKSPASKPEITATATPKSSVKSPLPTVDLTDSSSVLDSVAAPKDGTAAPIEDTVHAETIAKNTTAQAAASTPKAPIDESLLAFMLLAFGSGLVALLTPCVFPMIPMTVSFFTSGSASRAQGIVKALVYGLSIVAIYTIVGTIVAKLAGPDAANFLSTHWLPNILFFAVFVLFGLSFLGMFEITLPNNLVNKVDAQADKGGYYGVFFMAFTLVLVSFSCTGPIVGTILVQSAGGETLKPIMGMMSFGAAFAVPFTLFAIFPGWLSNLPKSGSWLNSVKVVLGFLELALALKFLSIADQVYHWHLLDREIYLALWIIIFTLLGFYLLGKLKLPHDSDLAHISVPRLLLALLTFAFVIYLVPGMFGAPLKALSGYLPPQSSLDFDLYKTKGSGNDQHAQSALPTGCPAPKYEFLPALPHGLQGYHDLKQALECAKASNKPVFVDFTGHGCVNCREMEANVWSDPKVLEHLQRDYVVVALYVDDKTELPKSDWYISDYDKKEKTSIGRQNADYQIRKYNVNAQPYYVLLSPEGKTLVEPRAYDLNVQRFVEFLDSGVKAFRKASGGEIASR